MNWRMSIGIIIAMMVGLGAYLATSSPPGLLSKLDAVMGGGSGVDHVGKNVRFGDHGQKLDIWRGDEASKSSRLPVLIFWHGGGWVKGSRQDYAFAAKAFAKRGFLVVVPDYRKVPDVHFPDYIIDGAQAVSWVQDNIAQYGGDPENIALSGHSAGAHTAVLIGLDPSWIENASGNIGSIKAVVGMSGPYDFYPFDKKRSIDAMGQYEEPERTQPVNFARADAPAMLLLTSTKDTIVRPRNAIKLTEKLKAAGASVAMINYEGLTHEEVMMAISIPFRRTATVLTDSANFLNENMRVVEP